MAITLTNVPSIFRRETLDNVIGGTGFGTDPSVILLRIGRDVGGAEWATIPVRSASGSHFTFDIPRNLDLRNAVSNYRVEVSIGADLAATGHDYTVAPLATEDYNNIGEVVVDPYNISARYPDLDQNDQIVHSRTTTPGNYEFLIDSSGFYDINFGTDAVSDQSFTHYRIKTVTGEVSARETTLISTGAVQPVNITPVLTQRSVNVATFEATVGSAGTFYQMTTGAPATPSYADIINGVGAAGIGLNYGSASFASAGTHEFYSEPLAPDTTHYLHTFFDPNNSGDYTEISSLQFESGLSIALTVDYTGGLQATLSATIQGAIFGGVSFQKMIDGAFSTISIDNLSPYTYIEDFDGSNGDIVQFRAFASDGEFTSYSERQITISGLDEAPPAPTFVAPSVEQFGPFTASIDFGEIVSGFALSQIVATNATLGGLVDGGSGVYSFTVTPVSDNKGVITLGYASGHVQDEVGLLNLAATQYVVAFDTAVAPSPVFSGPSLEQTGPFSVSIDFGETVTGFSLSQIARTNCTLSNPIDNSLGSYTFTVSPSAGTAGLITLDYAAGQAQDANGNTNTIAPQYSVAFEAPDVVPVQFSLGADVTDASIAQQFVRSFTVSGINSQALFYATGAAQLSGDLETWESSLSRNNGQVVYVRLLASNDYLTTVIGGAEAGLISDSFSVTTMIQPIVEFVHESPFDRYVVVGEDAGFIGTQQLHNVWDDQDKDHLYFCWDLIVGDASIVSSSFTLPAGWSMQSQFANGNLRTKRGNEYSSVNGALLSTDRTQGRHRITNDVVLSDGREYSRSVYVVVGNL